MPPRRSTRASSSSRLFDGSSEAGGPLDSHTTGARGMSPGPAKYSSAYGSPPTMVPTRQNVARQKYNFTTALSHVVSAVEEDNENDARERAERDAEQLRRRTGAAPTRTAHAAQRAESSPPEAVPPTRAARRKPREKTHVSESPEGPKDAASSARTRIGAVRASAPRPDATPARDFAAEDGIFAEAEIFTPAVPSSPPKTGAGVISRTSSMLQNILHASGRRASGAREDPNDEAIQQAYPELKFIASQPDELAGKPAEPAEPAQPAEPAEPAEPEPAPARRAKRTAAAAKPTSAHVATPGPKARSRKTVPRAVPDPAADELAIDQNDGAVTPPSSPGAATSRQRAKRSQPQAVAEEPVAEQPAAAEPEVQEPDAEEPVRDEAAARSRKDQWTAPLRPESQGANSRGGVLGGVARAIRVLATALTVLVLGAVALRVVVISTAPDALYEGYRVDNRLHWFGDDWRSNLRQFVPFALLHPLGAISDEEFARMNGLILSHANEVAKMRHTQRLHGDALESIHRILPAVVHMELDKHGRPVIAQDFWHALKDHIQADKDIFTLIPGRDGSAAVSDLQWAALKRQLEESGLLPDPAAKALSTRDVEAITETTLSRSWEAWLRRNQDKVRHVLGVARATEDDGRRQPRPSDGDLVEQLSDAQLTQLAQNMAASRQAREVLLPKQDFLQILQNTFVEHRLEIKGELADLEARVLDVARAAAQAVAPPPSSPSSSPGSSQTAGLSKKEMAALVDQLVRKSISNAQLEAMARGTIAANWRSALVNQVNFFSRNSGAAFNRHLSSPSYAPQKLSFWEQYQAMLGGGGGGGGSARGRGSVSPVPGSLQGSAALEPWEQDGDCWCASMNGSAHGSQHGSGGGGAAASAKLAVRLGLRVVPQYLVVEHISPSATLDPGAMPKDLELWAQVTDYAAQRPLMDWSLHQFPDTDDADPLFGWGFVKIGGFRFESGQNGDGTSGSRKQQQQQSGGEVQVFRLSPDLETLDAVTDHVLVRALTNYGGVDHTCFYRVRLYGEHRPDV